MTDVRQPVGLELIAAALERRRDELVARATRLIAARMPAYAQSDAAHLGDVRAHVAEHHDLLCHVLRRGHPATASEFDFVARHAALRTRRGVSLADFLEAFRAYHGVVWDAAVDAARDDRAAADEALRAARTMMRHIDLATTQAATAYVEAQQLLVADSDRAQRDLLEDLLAGRPPTTTAARAAAQAAALEADARCVLVSALPTHAPDDEHMLRLAATTIGAAVSGRTAPLVVTRHGEIIVVRALAAGERPALKAPLERACKRVAAHGLGLAIGVSTVHDGVDTLSGAYREASQAVARIAHAGGVLSLPDISAFEWLTVRDDAVARRLIAPRVDRFLAEDRAHGGTLTRTLLAYAAADLNVKVAAADLLIHVNTAHYRLNRIAETTGCDLRRLSDVIELLIAVRLTDGA